MNSPLSDSASASVSSAPSGAPLTCGVDEPLAAASLTAVDRLDRRAMLRLLGLGAVGTVASNALTRTRAGATVGPAGSGGWGIAPGPTTRRPPVTTPAPPNFAEVIQRVVDMPFDNNLRARANRFGLDVINVTWEDTGRDIGSSVGPNISDLTLQVREPLGRDSGRTHLLPVLRYPNFSDKTGDVAIDKVWVKVGNQQSTTSVVGVPLREVLSNMRAYLSDPYSLIGSGNFLLPRDTHVLTSAQHVFMPLPATGKAEFNPVLYNYQSSPGNPAVMTLLVTRQGTSITIIENYSGDQTYQSWGQQLFFNNKGQRTVFTAERKSAVKARVDSGGATAQDRGALEDGSDMVMIIQVPLVHAATRYGAADGAVPAPSSDAAPSASAAAEAPNPNRSRSGETSDVEQAVIGFGADQGPYRELAGRRWERDAKFPIRVTVQFYKATSNGVVSDSDLAAMKGEIDRVYSNADYVGSLVCPNGDRSRPTEWYRGRSPYRA